MCDGQARCGAATAPAAKGGLRLSPLVEVKEIVGLTSLAGTWEGVL